MELRERERGRVGDLHSRLRRHSITVDCRKEQRQAPPTKEAKTKKVPRETEGHTHTVRKRPMEPGM